MMHQHRLRVKFGIRGIDVTLLTDSNSVISSLDFNTKDVISITKIFAIKLSIEVILNRLLVTIF
jgi:hypothetical protein